MLALFTFALLISVNPVVSSGTEDNKCKGELKRCLAGLPLEEHDGLPVNNEQIKTLCRAYQKGMECVQSWNKECLPMETRLMAERQMASAQLFMSLLCSDEGFKREYLNHTNCFGGVRSDWDRCNNVFQSAVREINGKAHAQRYTQNIIDLCCARYGFNRCISQATKAKCDRKGAVMLRRISETLSHDARCDRFDTDLCSKASITILHTFTIILALVTTVFVNRDIF